jgi:hypothetical protein
MVILLSGPSGSGKTTVSQLLERRGWIRVAEDDTWLAIFGKQRGAFGSPEHRAKRAMVHDVVLKQVLAASSSADQQHVVLEATVHESPPEAFLEWADLLRKHALTWCLRVLLPRLEVATSRDALRASWHIGARGVAQLHGKFTRAVFAPEVFLDNSDESPEETCLRLVASAGLPFA